ncbi:MAG: ATP-binding protein [Syntrophobacteraceae bacterium]|nr:ATP-binding protein [Syntrophobacteraceae bacterium]
MSGPGGDQNSKSDGNEHVALIKAAQTAVRDTTRLTRLFAVLSEPAPLELMLDRVLSTLSELFSADIVALIDPAGSGMFSPLAAIGLPEYMLHLPMSGAESGCVCRAMATRLPIVKENVDRDPAVEPQLRELGVQTAVWTPVIGSHAARGVLILARCLPVPFAGTDVDLLSAMAYRIGLALEQSQRSLQLERIVKAGRKVSSTLNQEALFAETVDMLPTIFGADGAVFVLKDSEGAAQCVARKNIGPEWDFLWTQLAERLFADTNFAGFDPYAASNFGDDAHSLAIKPSGALPVRALLAVPVLLDGRVQGLLAGFRASVAPFGPDTCHMAMLFAAQVSAAMENVSLYRSLQEELAERLRTEDERRKLEDRLQRAEKMEALGTLAGGVAHDLNNVLGVIVGFSELLLYEEYLLDDTKSTVSEILTAGQRAAAIVRDLLTLARRGIQDRKVLNVNDILLKCLNSSEFESVVSDHPHVLVKTDLETQLLNISASSIHLEKSFLNLVLNAAEAMAGGGVLTIRTRNQYLDKPVSGYDAVKEGDYVVLMVSDTGEGIPAGDLKHIFEPFYTRKVMGRSGTGLGLAVVWGTVKDHGGYITVQSEEGKGAAFALYFPVTRAEKMSEQGFVSAAAYTGKGETILVVDDVKEQRDLATALLTKLKYNVSSVATGEEAVDHVKQIQADLLVLDMIMDPGMDGLDTYLKVLEIRPGQKAIIVSGFAETERVARALDSGAGAYVRKPYSLDKLGLAVRKELDKPVRVAESKAAGAKNWSTGKRDHIV